jgi:N-acyl homoserine lactone hydrolase
MSGQHDRFQMQRRHWGNPALQYQLVEEDEEVLPGITLIETSGHVPGHQSVLVRLRSSRKILLAIDAIATAAAADPDTYTAHPFDMDPDRARLSIAKLRHIMQTERVQEVFFGHDSIHWAHLLKAPAYYA